MRNRYSFLECSIFSFMFLGFFLTLIVHNISIALTSETPSRIHAIGDIHADIDGLEEILRVSGSVDSQGHIVSDLLLIIMGDIVGVGPNSPAVIKRLLQLKKEAPSKGSVVIFIAGNHDLNLLMNRFNYLSKEDRDHWRLWLSPDDDWKESIYQALRTPGSPQKEVQQLHEFYHSLVPWYQTRGKLFVHSGISRKMLEHFNSEEVNSFKNKINLVLKGQSSIQPSDWLFGPEGPTLTSQTADPEIAEFILDQPLEMNQFTQFLVEHQLDQVFVGHWTTRNGIQEHSRFGSRLLHLDTGISSPEGTLSYLEITPSSEVRSNSWRRGENTLNLTCSNTLN